MHVMKRNMRYEKKKKIRGEGEKEGVTFSA